MTLQMNKLVEYQQALFTYIHGCSTEIQPGRFMGTMCEVYYYNYYTNIFRKVFFVVILQSSSSLLWQNNFNYHGNSHHLYCGLLLSFGLFISSLFVLQSLQ